MMKKLVVTLLTVMTCGAVYALPVGNPGEASLFTNGIYCESNSCCDICDPCFSWCDAWSIRVGFYGNYVFDRHLEVDGSDDQGRDIEHTTIFTNAGYVALNLCDRFDFFATLGATRISIDADSRIFTTGDTPSWNTVAFDTTFSWSVGGRATIWQCDCFTVGIEGEYFTTHPDFDYFIDADNVLYSLDDTASTTYSEWQLGLGVSYTIATSCPSLALVPYLAVKWAGAHFDGQAFDQAITSGPTAQQTFNFPKSQNKKLWGYAVGTTFTLCDVAGITAEGRFGDEKALYINGQVRF